jgi:hypothetical protein
VPRTKIEPKQGDVFEVPLEDGRRGYGQVLGVALFGFFAVGSTERMPIEAVVVSPVAFRIECLSEYMISGVWPIIGNIALPPAMREALKLYRNNGHPDFWFLYEWWPETGGHERRVPKGAVSGLEAAGLWMPESAAQRLLMHLRGEPCPWVEIA